MTKYIKIYGERNSSTNYMSKLIKLNLDCKEVPGVAPKIIRKIQRKFPGNDLIKDIYFSLTYSKNLGWKHTCVKPIDDLSKYKLANSDISFVTITKNPYSWLLSLHRRPYHFCISETMDFESFISAKWKMTGRDNIKLKSINPIELWNLKNESYLQLKWRNALHLRTEDIILSPEKSIDYISSRLSIKKLSNNFINFKQSTKDYSKDYNYYKDYYLNEKWRCELTREAITKINYIIDKKIMSFFRYQVLM